MMKFHALFGLLATIILLTACGATEREVAISTAKPARPTTSPAATGTSFHAVSPVSPLPTPTLLPTDTPTPVPPTATPTPVPTLRPLTGNFANQIARLERAAPMAKSNLFVPPTDAEMADFAALWRAMAQGSAAQTQAVSAQHGYELLRYVDNGDERAVSVLLREKKPMRRGWGLYAWRIAPQNSLIIEVPHPLFDTGTPTVGLALFRTLNASALLVAGSHRYANANGSADAAHNPQTVFQAIHTAATADGSAKVLQIHGFAAANHPGYPQVVLGGNASSASKTLAKALAKALQNAELSVGVCGDGRWAKLCGTRNLQGDTMSGGTFLHIELDESVRANDGAFIAALESYWQK